MADLLRLIDDLTAYFKNHIEALPPQERRVFLALADIWEPASARDVSRLTRLDTTKCSAQLSRLIDRGVVEVVGGEPRRKLYYVSERLYNIYYLLRRSRTPSPLVKALIRFMEAYYSPPELKTVGSRMVLEVKELEAEARVLQWAAFSELINLPILAPFRKEMLSAVPGEVMQNQLRGTVATNVALAAPGGQVAGRTQPDEWVRELSEQVTAEDSVESHAEISRHHAKQNFEAVLTKHLSAWSPISQCLHARRWLALWSKMP